MEALRASLRALQGPKHFFQFCNSFCYATTIVTGTFFALQFVNLLIADRVAPAFRTPGPEEEVVERYRELVGSRTGLVRFAVAGVFALVVGACTGGSTGGG